MRRTLSLLAPAALAAALALAGCGDSRSVGGHADGDDGQCSGCHVSSARVANLAPGAAATEPGLAAHAAHAGGGGIAAAVECGECHRVPATVGAPGHMDGTVDVVFSERAGGAGALWNREQQSCAVYCHGSATPVWTQVDGTHARCGSCHGIPPGGDHPASASTTASCAGCHPATVRPDGTINAGGGAHVNGRVDRGGDAVVACGSCHGIPPGGGHTSSTSCGTCHQGYSATSINPALHQNGRRDVLSAEASCGSCHGIPPGGGHTSSTSCGSCHQGYSATSVNPALHQNGRRDVSVQACGSCHAIPPATGEHEKHVKKEISCGTCHQGATTNAAGPGHMNGAVDVSAPGWSAAELSCANACHGTKRWGK